MVPWWWSCWRLVFPPSGWCIWYMDACHIWSSQGLRLAGWAGWTAWAWTQWLTVALPKDGRVGEHLLHSPAGVKDGGLEFREPAAERRIGWVVRDDEGWCVTMKGGAWRWRVVRDNEGRPVGALLGLVLQRLGAGCVACSSVSFVLQVMAPTQEPPLHLVTAGVEHFHVHTELL